MCFCGGSHIAVGQWHCCLHSFPFLTTWSVAWGLIIVIVVRSRSITHWLEEWYHCYWRFPRCWHYRISQNRILTCLHHCQMITHNSHAGMVLPWHGDILHTASSMDMGLVIAALPPLKLLYRWSMVLHSWLACKLGISKTSCNLAKYQHILVEVLLWLS